MPDPKFAMLGGSRKMSADLPRTLVSIFEATSDNALPVQR